MYDTSLVDHLLSYFLGDPHGHGALAQPTFQNFASLPHPGSGEMNPPLGMTASYGPGSSRTSSNSTLTDADPPLQPRTPAMQFYHTSHSSSHSHSQPVSYARQTAENIAMHQQQQQQQQQQQTSSQLVSSSSSSSLSSLAATLVSGGAVLHHQIHHHHPGASGASHRMVIDHPDTSSANAANPNSRDSPPGHGDDSPLSPVAMIGAAHENLMLPPPSRKTASQASSQTHTIITTQASQAPPGQHQHHPNPHMALFPGMQNNDPHLEWINQLNARAKAAASQNPPPQNQPTQIIASGTMVSITHASGQSLVAQHPGAINVPPAPATHVFHAGTFASAAAAAAAVAQNPMLYQAAMNHKFHLAATSQGETEEKRARRLERNRESARKSRRRKKERLATLEAQVDRLHTQIEDERRNQVNAMCSTLKLVRREEMGNLVDDLKTTEHLAFDPALQHRLGTALRASSGASQIAQATVEFQYSTLKQVLLPRYQKFLLWVTLHDEGFFVAGKDEYTKKDGKQVSWACVALFVKITFKGVVFNCFAFFDRSCVYRPDE
jgi:bZIP transcription factor